MWQPPGAAPDALSPASTPDALPSGSGASGSRSSPSASGRRGASRDPERDVHRSRSRLRAVAQALQIGAAGTWFVENEVRGLPEVVLPGAVCLDVGAQFGLYTWTLAALAGRHGQVHAIEPQPGLCRLLRRNKALLGARHVEVHQVAIGTSPGTGRLSVPIRHRLPVPGRAYLSDAATGEGSNREFSSHRTLPVRTSTLDQLVHDELRLDRLDFLKADVEGAEGLLLTSGDLTLRRFRPVLLLELEDRHLVRFGTTRASVEERLAGHGYRPFTWRSGIWQPPREPVSERNVLFLPKRQEPTAPAVHPH
jgi:FkbM family methyltransferase